MILLQTTKGSYLSTKIIQNFQQLLSIYKIKNNYNIVSQSRVSIHWNGFKNDGLLENLMEQQCVNTLK